MTKFAIVRAEPTEEMVCAGILAKGRMVAAVYTAMLAASEPLTDAEVDELCRMMWPAGWYWAVEFDAALTIYSRRYREQDRDFMRAFIAKVSA